MRTVFQIAPLLSVAFFAVASPASPVPVTAGTAMPTLYGEIHGNEMTANCGVNVTAFAMKFFHKRVSLPGLALSGPERHRRSAPFWRPLRPMERPMRAGHGALPVNAMSI